MEEKRHYDAIVVGAGPAGSAAALVMARAGLKVALLERGESPGTKNVSGAAVYGTALLEELYPGFAMNAPIERHLTRKVLGFISDEALMAIDFKNSRSALPPYNGFSVIRPKFDAWLAEQACQAGALLICSTVADELIYEEDRVIGVRTRDEDGDLFADVVIAADGVNSFLAKAAGLQREFQPHEMSLGVKEIIALPRSVIEDRFQLNGDEGAAYEMVGSVTGPVNGGGFIYTNRESLSIGIVGQVSTLMASRMRPLDLLENFKNHPSIRPLLREGRVLEYSAHLIPEGGWRMFPKRFAPGMLVTGDAAGFVLVTGYLLLGINFALASGAAAGQAVITAKSKNDYSASSLAVYDDYLNRRGVLPTFKKFKGTPDFVNNDNLQNVYPQFICNLMADLYRVEAGPLPKVLGLVSGNFKKSGLSLYQTAKDLWQGGKALG